MPVPTVFITAESVDHGKPHPEPFLKAAKALGVDPTDCLVFEDADNGVNSALAAGCKVVVIGSACPIEHTNIISRIADFSGLTITEDRELVVGSLIIASYRNGDQDAAATP